MGLFSDAYFQLFIRDDGTYMDFFPAKGGNKTLIFEEIDEYISIYLRGVDYDRNQIYTITKTNLETRQSVKLCDKKIIPVNEYVKVYIAEDKMSASIKVYPPSSGGNVKGKQDIVNDMIHYGIKYGVKEEVLDKFIEDRTYNRRILIAEATKPIEGKNAEIVYYFNTDLTLKPKTNEDGSVDFHNLDTISHVNAGECLAELFPAVQGKPGIDVCGGILKPQKVINKILKHGQMIKMSDDNLKIYSEVDGHATLVDDRVFVSNTYEVPANVDASTGDIVYDGNVNVKGNVMTGYRIEAKGDVVVEGVVEGASIIAGGQIILKRGIQGMSRGYLKADGNIISKFIESAKVECAGYVQVEAILHSTVNARGDIIVGGKKGFISGGQIRSGGIISAKTIGSTMGTTTVVEVGVSPELLEEYRGLESEVNLIEEEKEQTNQNLVALAKRVKLGEKLPVEKILYIKNAQKRLEENEIRLKDIEVRLDSLKDEITNNNVGCIKVQGTIYPGVRITISNLQYHIKQELMYCKFIRDKAEVKMVPL